MLVTPPYLMFLGDVEFAAAAARRERRGIRPAGIGVNTAGRGEDEARASNAA